MRKKKVEPPIEEKSVKETWDRIWEKGVFPEWDSLSQLIFEVLKKEIGPFENKKILEAGSGSGRISLRLAQEGAKVTLLDASTHALELSKEIFKKAKEPAKFFQASIFDMSFDNESFDIVWNAGVLEHYDEKDQLNIVKEMFRVCKNDGLLITFNPYRWAIFYRIGKWYLEKTKKWQAGYERPIKSLKKFLSKNEAEYIKEYSAGFLEQFNFLIEIPFLKRFERILVYFKRKHWNFNSRTGYLLITIFSKGA